MKTSAGKDISSLTAASRPAFEDIRAWFDAALGRHLLNTERAMLDQLLPGLFGYHLTQLGVQDSALYESSPIQYKLRVSPDNRHANSLIANPAQLPFASDSIDLVLIHHLLDFADAPQEILREVSRVTLPMGHLVIVGFNPLSLWGIWRALARFKGRAPWNGSYIRPGRLMDWLNLLNFRIDRAQYAIYRPPIARYSGRVRDYSRGVSRGLNLPVGAVYVIVAKKHIGAVRPLRPVWKTGESFGRLSVVRSVRHDGPAVTPRPERGWF